MDKKKYSLKFVVALMLIASALTCFVMLAVFVSSAGFFGEWTAAVRDYATLLRRIDEVYIGRFDPDDLTNASLRAAVEALGDEWSYYLTPEEFARFTDSSNNVFSGIGVSISVDEGSGGMLVLRVFSGSPAEAAGVVAGDVILAVDGVSISGFTISEVRAVLARPHGEFVGLTVMRADGDTVDLTAEYNVVFVDPVSFELLAPGIGYISLANFDSGSAVSFISAVNHLLEEGASSFVFDVRSNPGGRVTEMTGILDFLLPIGEVFVAVDRDGNEEVTMSGPDYIDFTSVVLVDRFSFSAAEYFSAMLREYGRGSVVGEQTRGKNRLQVTLPLPGRGALHISAGEYLTKNRVSLFDAGGVTPDHQISLSDEEFALFITGNLEKSEDPQVQLAMSLLKNSY